MQRMQIFHSLDEIARRTGPSTVTVGSFDGIHRAHRELLRLVQERARQQGSSSVAVTFDPHPVTVLAPEKAPRMLTPLPIKLELLERSGIDALLILPFTLEFSRWSPARFVEEVLVKTLRAETVFVGENFHFGHRQAGNPQVLQEYGVRFAFRTEILEKVVLRNNVVSSSQIRILLEHDNITLANRLLGHPYNIRGPVEPGLGIGNKMTVPTFNLGPTSSLIPSQGVYITLARLGFSEPGTARASRLSASISSVTNVGCRPTFGERGLGVETHLLEPWSGTEPTLLDVSFLYRLREERKFDSAEQLKEQILRDVRRAQTYFRRLRSAGISLT
ncbi:MAG: bifunctional riboflavin kinase/FAD synthetase [Acidobacteria bacterium]|nr:bifunctional riboflavin kinase/FAD synthetase [Acidobacteriota bacterium]